MGNDPCRKRWISRRDLLSLKLEASKLQDYLEKGMEKRLYKGKNKMICGVCSGLADYCNIDPTIMRLLVAFLTVFGCGIGIIAYIIAAVIMPDKENLKETTAEID